MNPGITIKREWIGYLFLGVLVGCAGHSPLQNFKSQCESSGGVFMDCAVAFAEACSRAETIEGKSVICSCQEGKVWEPKLGCVKQIASSDRH